MLRLHFSQQLQDLQAGYRWVKGITEIELGVQEREGSARNRGKVQGELHLHLWPAQVVPQESNERSVHDVAEALGEGADCAAVLRCT